MYESLRRERKNKGRKGDVSVVVINKSKNCSAGEVKSEEKAVRGLCKCFYKLGRKGDEKLIYVRQYKCGLGEGIRLKFHYG